MRETAGLPSRPTKRLVDNVGMAFFNNRMMSDPHLLLLLLRLVQQSRYYTIERIPPHSSVLSVADPLVPYQLPTSARCVAERHGWNLHPNSFRHGCAESNCCIREKECLFVSPNALVLTSLH